MYKFGILDPRPIPAAEENNAKILGAETLGIEVTVAALAARCGLGNIDPQHTGGDTSIAAIEAAITAELPPTGATLVTVRADLDSVGAMAVLLSRAMGVELKEAQLGRVQLVAESDRFARGGWPGPRSLADPTADEGFLAAIAAAVSDFKTPVSDRVALMGTWILSGIEPDEYRARWESEREEIVAALADGRIRATTAAVGKVAVVESSHRAATSIGYRLAPVVVALNPEFRVQGGEPHAKFTVCQFDGTRMDLVAAKNELATMEPGWGGSPTIIGSPQGTASALTLDQVVEVVTRHLK